MSKTYTDLTETVFPDAVDTILRMSDVSASDITAVNQYYARYNAGDMTGAAQILLSNPALQNKIFNAEKFNKLIDAVIAIQRYYKDDVRTDIEQFRHCGTYVSTVSYKVGNIVNYDGGVYICCTNCSGVVPGTSSYWSLLIDGDASEQKYKGVYRTNVQYYSGNCVAYGGRMYQAVADSKGVAPGTNEAIWLTLTEGVTQSYVDTQDNQLKEEIYTYVAQSLLGGEW